jgi:hypothetical protein
MLLLFFEIRLLTEPQSTAVLGLKHPKFAAAALSTWVVGRLVYTFGYSTGNPANVSGKPSWMIFWLTYSKRMFGARINVVPQLGENSYYFVFLYD